MCCSELGSLRGARAPGETGEEKREQFWSSAAATMRSVKSSAGSPEHLPRSGPSSGVVGGLRGKILQNRVEGPSIHVASWVLACVCAEDGGDVCRVRCVLFDPGETPAWGHWGDDDRDGSGRASPDCEGFRSFFGFFSCSVLTSDPFGSLWWHLLGQPVILTEQEHPELTSCQGSLPRGCPVPSARLGCPLGLAVYVYAHIYMYSCISSPSPSSCISPGLVTPFVPAVTPHGGVPSD